MPETDFPISSEPEPTLAPQSLMTADSSISPLNTRAEALNAEAEQTRTRIRALQREHRDATKAHEEANLSYMNGTDATAQDVQTAAGLVATTAHAVQGLEARLEALAEEGRQITQEVEHARALGTLAEAAKTAHDSRRLYLDRVAAALPAVREIGRSILDASNAWRDACAQFLNAGDAAGLPPLSEAETMVSSRGEGGVVSTHVVPAQQVEDVLGAVLSLLADDVDDPHAVLAAAQEGHRLGSSPLTRDLHHMPLWGRTPATQPQGGEASRLLVRSLLDLASDSQA